MIAIFLKEKNNVYSFSLTSKIHSFITEEILKRALNMERYRSIMSYDHIGIIKHSQKSIMSNKETIYHKKRKIRGIF